MRKDDKKLEDAEEIMQENALTEVVADAVEDVVVADAEADAVAKEVSDAL